MNGRYSERLSMVEGPLDRVGTALPSSRDAVVASALAVITHFLDEGGDKRQAGEAHRANAQQELAAAAAAEADAAMYERQAAQLAGMIVARFGDDAIPQDVAVRLNGGASVTARPTGRRPTPAPDAPTVRPATDPTGRRDRAVLEFLDGDRRWRRPREVTEALGISSNTVRGSVGRLTRAGYLDVNADTGQYRARPASK
jgi:hypothetical protein